MIFCSGKVAAGNNDADEQDDFEYYKFDDDDDEWDWEDNYQNTSDLFECILCQRTFATYAALKRHNKKPCADEKDRKYTSKTWRPADDPPPKKKKGGRKPQIFPCDGCTRTFNRKADLTRHNKAPCKPVKEEKVESFECILCKKGFSQYNYLKLHNRYPCPGGKSRVDFWAKPSKKKPKYDEVSSSMSLSDDESSCGSNLSKYRPNKPSKQEPKLVFNREDKLLLKRQTFDTKVPIHTKTKSVSPRSFKRTPCANSTSAMIKSEKTDEIGDILPDEIKAEMSDTELADNIDLDVIPDDLAEAMNAIGDDATNLLSPDDLDILGEEPAEEINQGIHH